MKWNDIKNRKKIEKQESAFNKRKEKNGSYQWTYIIVTKRKFALKKLKKVKKGKRKRRNETRKEERKR